MTAMSAHIYQPGQPQGLGPWVRFHTARARENRQAPVVSAPPARSEARPSFFTSPGLSPLTGLLISGAVSTLLWAIVGWSAWALLS